MTCTCPKCQATIDLDLPEVTEAGTPATCPSCNSRFTVHRESFGGRALQKTGSVSCASCGAELGPETHCLACGAPFPDILVVGLGRKRARRKSQKVSLKSSPLPKKSAHTAIPSLDMSLKPEAAKAGPASKARSRSNLPKVIVAIVVLLALVGGGAFYYTKDQAEKSYIKAFVLASYCVQTGVERAQKGISKKAAEWKEKADAGQSYSARSSMEDERDFATINNRLEPALAKISQPPQKFSTCNDKLAKLQAVYNKMRNLALTPGNSLPAFVDNSGKLDAEYKHAVREYKTDMPEEVASALKSTAQKFRGLQPLAP